MYDVIRNAPLLGVRYLTMLRLFFAALAAVSLARVHQTLLQLPTRIFHTVQLGKALATMSVVLIVSVVFLSQSVSTDLGYGTLHSDLKIRLSGSYSDFTSFLSAMNWLANNVPLESRVLVQDTFNNVNEGVALPKSHLLALTPMYTGRLILGSWTPSNYIADSFAVTEDSWLADISITEDNPQQVIEQLVNLSSAFGIGYVLVSSSVLASALDRSGSFILRYSDGVFQTYQTIPTAYIFNPSEVRLVEFHPEKIVLEAVSTVDETLVKLTYYRNWKCRIDGREVPLSSKLVNNIPLININLTQATVGSKIVLTFEKTNQEILGSLLTLVQLSAAIGLIAYTRRRKISARPQSLSAGKNFLKINGVCQVCSACSLRIIRNQQVKH